MTKMIISGLAAALLAGCVAYYPYPYAVDATVSSTGETVYYTDETEDYVFYPGSVYYPWSSMDYFYFGNHYYRPAASFSFSIGGYAGGPWYGPYYGPYYYPGYYSTWNAPYYPYPYSYFGAAYGWGAWNAWYNPYWRHHYYGHGNDYGGGHGRYDDGRGGHDGGHDGGAGGNYGEPGYAGRPPAGTRPIRQVGNEAYDYPTGDEARERATMSRDRARQLQSPPGQGMPPQTSRQVSVAPSRSDSDRGMVVVNRNDSKVQPTRVEPVERQRFGRTTMPAQGPGTQPVRPATQAMPAAPLAMPADRRRSIPSAPPPSNTRWERSEDSASGSYERQDSGDDDRQDGRKDHERRYRDRD